jgi:rhodanese-related sulfurtransferase
MDEDDDLFEEEYEEEFITEEEELLVEEDETEEEEEEEEEVVVEIPVSEIKKRGKKPVDKEKFYVDPKQFDEQIVVYYKTGKMSDELALMVSKIAHKLSYAPNFINYTFREEMVGDGIIRMFKALMSKKYDREKGTNPFSYFTRIAFNAFRNRIKKEKHMRDTHEKYQNELMLFSENYNTLVRNNQAKILKDRMNKQ